METDIFKPEILRTGDGRDFDRLNELFSTIKPDSIFDHFLTLQKEFIKINSVKKKLSDDEIIEIQKGKNAGKELKFEGCWIYYPWRNSLMHLIDESDFISLRTSRNRYKITDSEQSLLMNKKVGIIGLSVGNSIAMNLVLERSAGVLRLADFDKLELSNLNRIRSDLFSLGIPKVVAAAREIAELDPFIEVSCFTRGINELNLDEFLTGNGKLDLLIEECDSLDIKILAREGAKRHGIPVLMETSDRGMLDVERFDLEPERPILHGLIQHLDLSTVSNLTTSEEKIPYLMPMVGIDTMSSRLKASALEVGQSLGSWPQLSTSVMLGSAILCDTYRRIMLKDFNESGRFIVDPSLIIKNSDKDQDELEYKSEGDYSLQENTMLSEVAELNIAEGYNLNSKEVEQIVETGCLAPSGGNSQPWKWLYHQKLLHLFFDKSRSESFMDYRNSASFISLGSAIENVRVKSEALGYKVNIHLLPSNSESPLIATFSFSKSEVKNSIITEDIIQKRYTDRSLPSQGEVSVDSKERLVAILKEFPSIEYSLIENENSKGILGEVVSISDRLRIMHPGSHHDFIFNEMRWKKDQIDEKRDGIFVDELNLSPSNLAGLHLIKDKNVIEFIDAQKLGQGLKEISYKLVTSSPLIIYTSSMSFNSLSFIEAGILLEKLWLECTALNLGFQVLNVPFAFLLRLKNDDLNNLSQLFLEDIDEMKRKMTTLFPNWGNTTDLFLVRIFPTKSSGGKSVRRNLKEVLVFG